MDDYLDFKQLKGIFSYNISILKKSKYKQTAIGAALLFLVLFSFLYGLFKIPVIDFGIVRMTPVSFYDLTYILLTSVLMGALVALLRYKTSAVSLGAKGSSGTSGLFAGFISAVCPVCQTLSIAAAGSTIASIPTGFLLPYIGLIRGVGLALLSFALFSIAYSLYTKTCPTCVIPQKMKTILRERPLIEKPLDGTISFLQNKLVLSVLVVLVAVIILNQFLTTSAFASLVSSPSGGAVSISSGSLELEYGPKTTLKPMPLAAGEQPVISGYKTKVKSLPTISELTTTPSTGDLAQDLLNNVVPRGTPWYGQEAGVSFDDPITSQKLWAKGRAIQLDGAQEERWNRIANSFTCDYCCGSPQNPTIITRCGCAHSASVQGMSKWFIKNYGDNYSDEEIYGEMARWYAVWYPGPTIKRIVQEASL